MFALVSVIRDIFPAYAGVSPICTVHDLTTVDIPRVCGGEPGGYKIDNDGNQYSPRMRG